MREFGWTIWEYRATPEHIVQELASSLLAEAEAIRVRNRSNDNSVS